MNTNFSAYHKNAAEEIEKELQRVARGWNQNVATAVPELKKLNNQFTDSYFGGKMLRGMLIVLGYELTNAKPTRAIYQPAAAFEIVHTALLIHDDIIDQSPLRRGKPAFHIHKDKHYGMSQALCIGDIGIVLATQFIAESTFSNEIKTSALTYFLKIVSDTILGEMLDVHATTSTARTEKQVNTIQKMKTAQYTIVGPLTFGALLGGASEEMVTRLKQFGEPLGIAYQIQDDILGIFGEEKAIGKSATSDIEENKSTLLITYALKHSTPVQHNFLTRHYGKKEITNKQQETIKQIFIETGALTHSQDEIKKLSEAAKKIIPSLSEKETQQKILLELCDFLLKRTA